MAEVIGRSIADIARTGRSLCITHLPQIAALADAHFVVDKTRVARTDAGEREAADAGGEGGRGGEDDRGDQGGGGGEEGGEGDVGGGGVGGAGSRSGVEVEAAAIAWAGHLAKASPPSAYQPKGMINAPPGSPSIKNWVGQGE